MLTTFRLRERLLGEARHWPTEREREREKTLLKMNGHGERASERSNAWKNVLALLSFLPFFDPSALTGGGVEEKSHRDFSSSFLPLLFPFFPSKWQAGASYFLLYFRILHAEGPSNKALSAVVPSSLLKVPRRRLLLLALRTSIN